MTIGVDISQIAYPGTGVSRFTKGLVDIILKKGDKHNWKFFFSSLRGKFDSNIISRNINKNINLYRYYIPPSILSFLWNKLHIGTFENFVGACDWVITSDWTEPPAKGKKATVIHDLAYFRFPDTVDISIQRVQKSRLYHVERESNIIFADSQSTKEDLNSYVGIRGDRVKVMYPGVQRYIPTESEIKDTKDKLLIKKPFILTVGKIEPRKNLKRLIKAYEALGNSEVDLYIAGGSGWENLSSTNTNIRLLGYVSEPQLWTLYASCLFFAYPSIWEGFGYPVIEAMLAGAPVTCSDTSAVGEIVGDAALTFNPLITDDIKIALDTMIKNPELRTTLVNKGKIHGAKFSWNTYYDTLIDTLQKNA